MNKEEFNKSLSKFLEKETYIMVYRTNYDSAREFNNELINYIKQLQQENKQLKEELEEKHTECSYQDFLTDENIKLKQEKEELKKWLKYKDEHTIQQNNYYSVLDKIKELEEGVK